MRRSANALSSEEEPNSKSPIKINNNNKRCRTIKEESETDIGVCKGIGDENVDESNINKLNGHLPSKDSVLEEQKKSEDRINSSSFLHRRKKGSTGIRKSSNDGPDVFSNISDELILYIFQYLSKKCITDCAQVCRRWRSVSYTETLWTRLDLTGRTLQTDTMAYIISRNPRLVKMPQVDICTPIFAECADIMANTVWRVEYLDLSMAVVKSADLATLLSKCSELRKLSLEHCTTDVNVCASVASNDKLETLNMAMCYELSCEGVTQILEKCHRLKELNLAWTNLDKDSVQAVCSLVNEDVTHLDISGCKNLQDEQACQLLDRCRSLVYLDASDCTAISATTFETIKTNLTKLQQLSVSRCYKISPSLYPTVTSMSKLSHFNVFGILNERQTEMLKMVLTNISVNGMKFSTIARPTVGIRRTSIWGLKTRDYVN